MHHELRLSVVLAAFALAACSSSSGDAGTSSSPLTDCSAEYRCTVPEASPFDTNLHREGDGRCMMGEVELAPDGHIHGSNGLAGTWTGDTQHLSLCDPSSACVSCFGKGSAASPATEKKCTGSPDSCSSNGPGSCSNILGCRMVSHLRYDGSWENKCDGYPVACDGLGEENCHRQGCTWK